VVPCRDDAVSQFGASKMYPVASSAHAPTPALGPVSGLISL
jgi:hypothetical protein